MHILILILILAPTPSTAEQLQAALGDTADRYTVATAWSEVESLLTNTTAQSCPKPQAV
jgi:hypothetical protein